MDIDDLFGDEALDMRPLWNTDLTNSKPFTRADFDAAVDLVFRDHGIFGRHSVRCVYVQEDGKSTEWCCATECEIARRFR